MNIPEFIDSRFRFAIMVARRAKQLINGAPKLVDVKAENPLTIAIEEVASGKVTYETLRGVGVYFNETVEDSSEDVESEASADEQPESESEEQVQTEDTPEEEPEKSE